MQGQKELDRLWPIPVWYTNKITIIDFSIYTRFLFVKLKIVADGPILHSKSVVDGPFQYGIIINLPSYILQSIHCFSLRN